MVLRSHPSKGPSVIRDDIIHMAEQAGLLDPGYPVSDRVASELGRFAALVAEHERKACAEHYLDVMRKAVLEEREGCAVAAERSRLSIDGQHGVTSADQHIATRVVEHCAAATRARKDNP